MNQLQQQARDRAAAMLNHYLTIALEAGGRKVDSDTRVEIDSIVDDIIIAATPAAKGEQPLPNKTPGSHENPLPATELDGIPLDQLRRYTALDNFKPERLKPGELDPRD